MTPEQILFFVRFTIMRLAEYGLCDESEAMADMLRIYERADCTLGAVKWELDLAWSAGLAFEARQAARVKLWQ